MLKYKICILLLLLVFTGFSSFYVRELKKGDVVAYLRVKNEIKTIEACLNSIDGVFDRIVIIHSNEKDDGSVALMNKWCEKRAYCEIHEYPYEVIPSHDVRNRQNPKYENTLAAYNNFGLTFFEDNDWVVKIDADQVYLTERLKEFVSMLKSERHENKRFELKGYNTFSWNGYFVKYKAVPINGVSGDSYVVRKKNFDKFVQVGNYEDVRFKNVISKTVWYKPVWFHFMQSLKSGGKIYNKDNVTVDKVQFLSEEEKDIFNTRVRLLLKNSPYYGLKLDEKE